MSSNLSKLCPAYYDKKVLVFSVSGTPNYNTKEINITEEGLYLVSLFAQVSVSDIGGPYITTSTGLSVLDLRLYGVIDSGIAIPMFLIPDKYILRKGNGSNGIYCSIYKYVKE